MPDETPAETQPPVVETVLTEQAPVENEADATPDPNVELSAKLDAFQATWDAQLTELKQTVGRAQSVADKAGQREPDAALQKELNSTQSLFDELLSGLDPEALPAEVRTKLLAARASVAQEANREALKQELKAEIREEFAPAAAPAQAAPTANSALEQRLVQDIQKAGLNPDDAMFNWSEYATLLRGNPTTGAVEVALKVAEVIAGNSASTEDAQRDAKKKDASPGPAGGSAAPAADDLSATLNNPNLDLDQKKAALMAAIR